VRNRFENGRNERNDDERDEEAIQSRIYAVGAVTLLKSCIDAVT
jgi:hypothetical protein